MRSNFWSKTGSLRAVTSAVAVLVLLLGALSVAPSVADAQGSRFNLTVQNDSRYTIYQFYMSSSERSDWGSDLLGRNVLAPRNSFVVNNITPGEYDIKMVDEDGDVCELRRVMVTRNSAYRITTQNLLRCEGYS